MRERFAILRFLWLARILRRRRILLCTSFRSIISHLCFANTCSLFVLQEYQNRCSRVKQNIRTIVYL